MTWRCVKHNRDYNRECSACTLDDMVEVAKDPVAPRLHHLQDDEIVVKRGDIEKLAEDIKWQREVYEVRYVVEQFVKKYTEEAE